MKKTGRSTCGLLLCIAVITLLAGCAAPASKDTSAADRLQGIEQVSHVRRLLRSACGRLKVVNAGAEGREALMASAKDETAAGLAEWDRFLQEHGSAAPRAYAGHPDWRRAADELSAGMSEMLKAVEQNDAQAAFNTCGRACGKFVVLNEQAGVRRTSDVLFHFRKAAKPLTEPLAKGDLNVVSTKVPQLREIRDKAMGEPVGGTGTAAQKTQALEAFSAAVDAFGSAVQAGDREQISLAYGKMMAAMEKAYDLFL